MTETIKNVLYDEIARLSDDTLPKRIINIKEQIKNFKSQLKKAEGKQTKIDLRIIELQTFIDGINNNITK